MTGPLEWLEDRFDRLAPLVESYQTKHRAGIYPDAAETDAYQQMGGTVGYPMLRLKYDLEITRGMRWKPVATEPGPHP